MEFVEIDYELGLKQLLQQAEGTDWLQECFLYEARLRENLRRERYGTTEQIRSERMTILDELNMLSYKKINISFNDLCRKKLVDPSNAVANQTSTVEKPKSAHISVQNVPNLQLLSKNVLSPPQSIKTIFISYSSKDRAYSEELRTYITDYIREGTIVCWDDEEIHPIAIWKKEREKALQAASMVVLLVSKDFLKSNFLLEHDLPYLLTHAENEQISILSVIVRPCSFQETELTRFQTGNSPLQPLNTMTPNERNKIWAKVSENIKKHLTREKI